MNALMRGIYGLGLLIMCVGCNRPETLGEQHDAGADAGTSASSCPADPFSSGRCEPEDLSCNYGKESCCGVTYDSIVCYCRNGQLQCRYTDACLLPLCPDGG